MSFQRQLRSADFKALIDSKRKELMAQVLKAGTFIRDIEGGRFDEDDCLDFLGMKTGVDVAKAAHRKKVEDAPAAAPPRVDNTAELERMATRQSSIERNLTSLAANMSSTLETVTVLTRDLDKLFEADANTPQDASDLVRRVEALETRKPDASVQAQASTTDDKSSLEAIRLELSAAIERASLAIETAGRNVTEDLTRHGETQMELQASASREFQSLAREASEAVSQAGRDVGQAFREEAERHRVTSRELTREALDEVVEAFVRDTLPAIVAQRVERALNEAVSTFEGRPKSDETTSGANVERTVDEARFAEMEERLEALAREVSTGVRTRPERSEKALVSSHPRFKEARMIASEHIRAKGVPVTVGEIIDAIKDEISDVEISPRDAGNRFQKMGLQRVMDPSAPSRPYWWIPEARVPEPYRIR